MSPELLWPEKFEFENSKPTKGSDVYALGVIIYEVRPPSVVGLQDLRYWAIDHLWA